MKMFKGLLENGGGGEVVGESPCAQSAGMIQHPFLHFCASSPCRQRPDSIPTIPSHVPTLLQYDSGKRNQHLF